MSLLDFYKTHKETVLKFKINQLINTAGDGKLKDGSECSEQFRKFLSFIPISNLRKLTDECLRSRSDDKGFILQDIVNELGKRLDYKVENGLYRGRRDEIGFDGLWVSNNNMSDDILVETKSASHINFPLDKIAGYREKLIEKKSIKKTSSILIVVGSESSTAELEAQIRGSQHSNIIRIISIGSLIQLVEIKQEKLGDIGTIFKIREIFKPEYYTKLDKIIDILFSTTEKIGDEQIEGSDDEKETKHEITPKEVLRKKREETIKCFSDKYKVDLIKKTKVVFQDETKDFRVYSVVSKRYSSPSQRYWYAYEKKYDEFLRQSKNSFYILSCIDHDYAYAIPHKVMEGNLENLNFTKKGGNEPLYWHICLTEIKGGKLTLNLSKIRKKINLEDYKFKVI
jgi:hypothetical protein|tara:strand:- start:89 stop:1282 length:1194 start_codon:yes stop_codon:yes gene_type:complete